MRNSRLLAARLPFKISSMIVLACNEYTSFSKSNTGKTTLTLVILRREY